MVEFAYDLMKRFDSVRDFDKEEVEADSFSAPATGE